LGIRVGLSILSILVILVIGFSISPAYAGPPMTDVWVFYGKGPFTQPGNIGGGFLDATQNPAVGCTPDVSCFTNVDTSDGALINVGHQRNYHNVANSGPNILVTCFDDAPTPNLVDGTVTINFDTITDWDCLQNQRNANDIGMGATPLIAAPIDEIDDDELIVFDLTLLVAQGYTDFMYRLSSNTGTDKAWLAFSDKAPTGSVSFTAAETVFDVDTDTYKSFPLKKYLYISEVADDMLFQQIKAVVPVIGGTGIQIDTTSILLAGAQTNAFWIIPIVVSGIIIGIITIRRK